jgi:hypothetical protein
MARTAHIIGNGDRAGMFKQPQKGIKITCNLPPFNVEGVYATCLVDFKIMHAMHMAEIVIPGDWILGFRPHKYLEMNPDLRIRWGAQIRDYFTDKPPYAPTLTDWNCGHMATRYACHPNKIDADVIHMYGFDSIFDMNLKSCSDFYLNSDRSDMNQVRLADNWRPIWVKLFEEFPEKQFVLHHNHETARIPLPDNVDVTTK